MIEFLKKIEFFMRFFEIIFKLVISVIVTFIFYEYTKDESIILKIFFIIGTLSFTIRNLISYILKEFESVKEK